MKMTYHLLMFCLALVCVGQLIFFVNAIIGGREGRLYFMGALTLSPLAILLCLAAGAVRVFAPGAVGYRNSYTGIAVAVFIGQIMMFCFG